MQLHGRSSASRQKRISIRLRRQRIAERSNKKAGALPATRLRRRPGMLECQSSGSEIIGQNFHCCRNVYTESVPAHENPCLYLYHAARVLSCANECAGIDHAASAGSIRNSFHPVFRREHAVERARHPQFRNPHQRTASRAAAASNANPPDAPQADTENLPIAEPIPRRPPAYRSPSTHATRNGAAKCTT